MHMISMLRKEACPGSIHDLAHIPTQDCLADWLTKASAKADNLITAVQTGKLLDVHLHPDFMEHKIFVSTWCKSCLHKGKASCIPENSQDLTCKTSPRRIISGDICEDSTYQGAKGIEYA